LIAQAESTVTEEDQKFAQSNPFYPLTWGKYLNTGNVVQCNCAVELYLDGFFSCFSFNSWFFKKNNQNTTYDEKIPDIVNTWKMIFFLIVPLINLRKKKILGW